MNTFISVLWLARLADEAIYWNPYNKVVQSHRDGTVYRLATNVARKRRGLPKWTPELGDREVRQPAVL